MYIAFFHELINKNRSPIVINIFIKNTQYYWVTNLIKTLDKITFDEPFNTTPSSVNSAKRSVTTSI